MWKYLSKFAGVSKKSYDKILFNFRDLKSDSMEYQDVNLLKTSLKTFIKHYQCQLTWDSNSDVVSEQWCVQGMLIKRHLQYPYLCGQTLEQGSPSDDIKKITIINIDRFVDTDGLLLPKNGRSTICCLMRMAWKRACQIFSKFLLRPHFFVFSGWRIHRPYCSSADKRIKIDLSSFIFFFLPTPWNLCCVCSLGVKSCELQFLLWTSFGSCLHLNC